MIHILNWGMGVESTAIALRSKAEVLDAWIRDNFLGPMTGYLGYNADETARAVRSSQPHGKLFVSIARAALNTVGLIVSACGGRAE